VKKRVRLLWERWFAAPGGVVEGKVAFLLHDTYGVNIETQEWMAEKHGLKIDKDSFQAEMEAQRERSRQKSKEA